MKKDKLSNLGDTTRALARMIYVGINHSTMPDKDIKLIVELHNELVEKLCPKEDRPDIEDNVVMLRPITKDTEIPKLDNLHRDVALLFARYGINFLNDSELLAELSRDLSTFLIEKCYAEYIDVDPTEPKMLH